MRAVATNKPLRDRDRLLTVANPRDDVSGVIALIDPEGSAGEAEEVALEHGATVLAMELARLRSLAETEIRLGSDLLEELLDGNAPANAVERAKTLGFDLHQTSRVVAIESGDTSMISNERLHRAVRDAARETGLEALVGTKSGAVVALAGADSGWHRLRAAIVAHIGGARCHMGLGGRSTTLDSVSRSYHEAQVALRTQSTVQPQRGVTKFDDLGVYKVLSQVPDNTVVNHYVREWIGILIDHDERKNSQFVLTLSRFLDLGGSYDASAKALSVHRNTLRYRLKRIQEITGFDLNDPDVRFNLQLATRSWTALHAIRGI